MKKRIHGGCQKMTLPTNSTSFLTTMKIFYFLTSPWKMMWMKKRTKNLKDFLITYLLWKQDLLFSKRKRLPKKTVCFPLMKTKKISLCKLNQIGLIKGKKALNLIWKITSFLEKQHWTKKIICLLKDKQEEVKTLREIFPKKSLLKRHFLSKE